jgi:hypothetical protein
MTLACHFVALGPHSCALARYSVSAVMKSVEGNERFKPAAGEFMSRVVLRLAMIDPICANRSASTACPDLLVVIGG